MQQSAHALDALRQLPQLVNIEAEPDGAFVRLEVPDQADLLLSAGAALKAAAALAAAALIADPAILGVDDAMDSIEILVRVLEAAHRADPLPPAPPQLCGHLEPQARLVALFRNQPVGAWSDGDEQAFREAMAHELVEVGGYDRREVEAGLLVLARV